VQGSALLADMFLAGVVWWRMAAAGFALQGWILGECRGLPCLRIRFWRGCAAVDGGCAVVLAFRQVQGAALFADTLLLGLCGGEWGLRCGAGFSASVGVCPVCGYAFAGVIWWRMGVAP
jgi:hypothetical protein